MKKRNMRLSVLFLLLLIAHPIFSQKYGLDKKESYFTYVYQPTDSEITKILQQGKSTISEEMLHTPIDTLWTHQSLSQLKPGNYLLLKADDRFLNIRFYQHHHFVPHIHQSNQGLLIDITDLNGLKVINAKVKINGQAIKPNRRTGQYLLKGRKKAGLLSITQGDKFDYFQLSTNKNNRNHRFINVFHTKPVGYIWYPFRAVYLSIKNKYPYGWVEKVAHLGEPSYESFQGFIAFNKPIYKKGDSVKVKAYVTSRKGRPINKELDVDLWVGVKKIKLTTLKPYRKGGYSYQFTIPDSLDVKPNDRLTIDFSSKGRSISEPFKYEQYELTKTKYDLSSESKVYYKGEPINLTLTAKDDNGLPAFGTRGKIKVLSGSINQIFKERVLIPNVLFEKTLTLKNDGSVTLSIPDSIFHQTSMGFKVLVDFIDAENRVKTKTLRLSYKSESIKYVFSIEKDSIQINAFKNNQPFETKAALDLDFTEGDYLESEVNLPYKGKINPYAISYWIYADSTLDFKEVNEWKSLVNCSCFGDNDSVFFDVSNSRKLPFHYELYKGGHLVDAGFNSGKTEGLSIHRKRKGNGSYFFKVNYIWGGKTAVENCRQDFYEKQLLIEATHPSVIVPGQSVEIDLLIKNNKGKPMENVDLTAFGFSNKFKTSNVPDLPYYGKGKKNQKSRVRFRKDELPYLKTSIPLDWNKFKKSMGLDTMDYYNFLYAENGFFQTHITLEDSFSTEFSPYYTEIGQVYKPVVLYLDGYPIYYEETSESNPRYSFKTTAGIHSLKMRTADKLIIVDSVNFKRGFKSILNFNNKINDENTLILDMPRQLTDAEQKELWNYLIKIDVSGKDYATIKQGYKLQYIENNYRSHANPLLIGPLRPTKATYKEPNLQREFEVEPGYAYYFDDKITKLKSYPSKGFLDHYLRKTIQNDKLNFGQRALTATAIEDLKIEQWRSKGVYRWRDHRTDENNSEIHLKFEDNDFLKNNPVNRIILLRKKDKGFLKVYNGTTKNFHNLAPDTYQLLFILENGYVQLDQLTTVANSALYITKFESTLKENDLLIYEITQKLKRIGLKIHIEKPKFNQSTIRYLQNKFEEGRDKEGYASRVVDSMGEGIPGVNVLIKGTRRGAITDINGYYDLNVPTGSVLQFSFIGLQTTEVKLTEQVPIEVTMLEDVQSLQEVVVTAYGEIRTQSLSGSISTINRLQGRVAGVAINQANGNPGSSVQVRVRGLATLDGSEKPLYIIDGIAYGELPQGINEDDFQSIDLMKGSAATALYGSSASNGVVIISTKNAKVNQVKSNLGIPTGKIRRNFHDDAFWEPKLKTDKNGHVSIKTKFPDDITQWQLHFLAVGDKKRTGQNSSQIKTFQPVSAELIVPNFLLDGDQINLRGKTSNFTTDSLAINSQFKIDDQQVSSTQQIVHQYNIDSVHYQVPLLKKDSIAVTYSIQYGKDKIDGEERKIPVLPSGVEEAYGIFQELALDSTYLFKEFAVQEEQGDMTLTAIHNPLDMFMDDYVSLTGYAYNCNEQMASKLLAWFALREAKGHIIKASHKTQIKKMVNQLSKNKNSENLWGWWGQSRTNWWISKHVLQALLAAEKAGFEIKLPKEEMRASLKYLVQVRQDRYMVNALEMLLLLDEKEIRYEELIHAVRKDTLLNLNQEIRLSIVAEKLSLKSKVDSLMTLGKLNPFGGLWFGDPVKHVQNNDIVNSALMLKLLITASKNEIGQKQIASFLISKRGRSGWRNTYESVKVLSQLMPFFKNHYKKDEPVLTIQKDGLSEQITKFPFIKTYKNGQFKVTHSGGGQVFFTAYQQKWVKNPQRIDSLIVVNTLLNNDQPLIQGVNTKLKVEIETIHSLDYVMVSIPIPAGCSIIDKKSQYELGADHISYEYDRVNIYFTSIRRGNKELEIDLTPRFSGAFQLNPCKVELMYFPTYFGREAMKNVKIK